MNSPISIHFPLAGEWYVGADGTEPGHELAFDFMHLDEKLKATTRPAWRELFTAIPYEQYHGWGQTILSPFNGRVVTAVDGCPEHSMSFLMKVFNNLRASLSHKERNRLAQLMENQTGDIREFAGNHLIIESIEHADVYAFLAHARLGSLRVHVGDIVQALQPIAEVGDSGQSSTPHLHFHLMSSANPLAQQLIPFTFLEYEVKMDGNWVSQEKRLPSKQQRIRRVG